MKPIYNRVSQIFKEHLEKGIVFDYLYLTLPHLRKMEEENSWMEDHVKFFFIEDHRVNIVVAEQSQSHFGKAAKIGIGDFEMIEETAIIPDEAFTCFLNQLAIKYGSDKGSHWHNYCVHYEAILPKTCRSFLEVGIAKGASALMWSEYYGEDLDLHFIDLFMDADHVTPRWCRNRGIVPHKGSQSDIHFLSTIKEQFEIIVEDGSHNCFDQIATFKHLFVNNMVPNGIYFMEDTHTSRPEESFYWNNGVGCFADTPLWMFRNYIETGKIRNKFFSEGESEMFENLIDKVEILADEKLIVIWKK